MNRNDPLDDTISTAIFQNKEVAGDAILEIINNVLTDSGSPIKLIELKSLTSQRVIIPDTDARYVRLDVHADAVVYGVKVFVNTEIQLHDTIDMTNRSLLHIANILVLFSQEHKGEEMVEFHSKFPYLVVINLLDYPLQNEDVNNNKEEIIYNNDIHKLIQLCYTDSGKPATDKVEIHHIQLPLLTETNFDETRPLHLLIGALQKRRGNLKRTDRGTKMFEAIEQYEKDNKGFKQFSQRYDIVRGKDDKEVLEMVQTQNAPAMERYITMEELRAQGEVKGRYNVARRMLRRGRPIEEIIEDTDLSLTEIEGLRETENI